MTRPRGNSRARLTARSNSCATTRIAPATELLRDLTPEQRKTGMMPELLGVQGYKPSEFQEKVDWMMDRGFLETPAYKDVVRSK